MILYSADKYCVMKKHILFLYLLAALCGTVPLLSFSQSAFEGNSLLSYLGKDTFSQEAKSLKANYHFEMVNEAHYLSNAGIELILQKGLINEIHLYQNSPVYGSFKNQLPNGLKFGMSSGAAKQLLGKPVASYNNGYCEFENQGQIISCWFEGGKLNQVGLAVK